MPRPSRWARSRAERRATARTANLTSRAAPRAPAVRETRVPPTVKRSSRAERARLDLGRELVGEPVAGVVKARHDRADGATREAREITVRLAVELAQHEHLAVARRQAGERAAHGRARL